MSKEPSYDELRQRLQQLEKQQNSDNKEKLYSTHMRQMLSLLRTMNQSVLEETDQQKLIDSVCKGITDVPGYNSAFIALLDESRTNILLTASSSIHDFSSPLFEQLGPDKLPACVKKVLVQSGFSLVQPGEDCRDCDFSNGSSPHYDYVCTLGYEEHVYGVLVVSTDEHLFNDKEIQYLFAQVASEIGCTLHRLMREEYLLQIDSIFNSIPHPMCLISKDYKYHIVNNKYAELYNIHPSKFIGSSPMAFFGQELYENELKKNLELCLTGKEVCFQSLTELPTKGPTWMEVSYFPYHDEGGNIIGVLTHRMDITERKNSEIKLRKSEERFAFLSDASIEAQFFILENRCIDVNLTATKMFGYDAEEFLGTDCTGLIAGQRRKKVKKVLSSSADSRLELDGVRRDGTVFPMVIRARTMPYKNNINVRVLSVLDITDKKESEEALLLAEHSLEQIDYMIFWINETGSILKVNNYTIDRLGYSAKELRSRDHTRLNFGYSRNQRAEHWKNLQEKKNLIYQTFFTTRNGERFPVELESHYLEFYQKRYEVLIAKDISERRKIEQVSLQSYKMEALTTLAGGIAHDFNNILSSILGFTELTKLRLQNDEDSCRMLNHVLDSGLAARKLVQQILTFSRSTEFEKSNLNIVPLVKECLKNLSPSLQENIETRLDCSHEDIEVYGDPVQLHQLFMNLFYNGCQAMEKEGGTLSIKASTKKLYDAEFLKKIGIEPGIYVELIVQDTGYGIEREVKKKIFDPFFSTRTRGKSTGMGLSVVYGIVEEMNGEIVVESEPDQGATFTVYLPLQTG